MLITPVWEIDDKVEMYSELKQWRQQQIKKVLNDPGALNQFHDTLMKRAIEIAISRVESEWGPPPARFAFFIMGSAGRSEQSVWSDQDHGLIYHGDENSKTYFLRLGSEITKGLHEVGYELCDGNVMASNPLWCNSLTVWEKQICDWLGEESWESLRRFSTFFDSRVLVGDEKYLLRLKELSFSKLEENPHLYFRLVENVSHIRKGIGLFGQLLPGDQGQDFGTINLKERVFFPYVNSVRLLALKERLTVPSTLSRLKSMPVPYLNHNYYYSEFAKLLHYRLYFQKHSVSYGKVHLLDIKQLSKKDKQELKQIMKSGYKLFSETKAIIEKGVRAW